MLPTRWELPVAAGWDPGGYSLTQRLAGESLARPTGRRSCRLAQGAGLTLWRSGHFSRGRSPVNTFDVRIYAIWRRRRRRRPFEVRWHAAARAWSLAVPTRAPAHALPAYLPAPPPPPPATTPVTP